MSQKSLLTTINHYNNSWISIFIFSGDLPQLGKSELFGILESNNIQYKILEEQSRIIILSFMAYDKKYDEFFKRIAYCNYFGILLFHYSSDLNVLSYNEKCRLYLDKIKTFSVRKLNVPNKIDIEYESIIGGLIKDSFPKLTVNLDNPEVSLFICKINNAFLIFSNHLIQDSPRWLNRRPRARPFFLPFAIHPKLSRALINLCRLKPNQTLLDPFCGTGSIGIEASILNINFIGVDISRKICLGAQRNSNYFKLKKFNIIHADSLQLPISEVDGIVTDFPYGRSSIKKFSNIHNFMEDFFNEISVLLKENSYFVYMIPKDWPEYLHPNYNLIDQHEIYIHSSLTRIIKVVQKY